MLVWFQTVTGPFNGSEDKHLYYDTNIHTKYFTVKLIDKESPLWPALYVVGKGKTIIGES